MLYDIIMSINSFLWGWPFIIFILIVGIYFMWASKFFPIIHFFHILNCTIFSILKRKSKQELNSKQDGTISPIEAVCIAIGGSVGCTAIGGVATAIAVGGPGAVFWM